MTLTAARSSRPPVLRSGAALRERNAICSAAVTETLSCGSVTPSRVCSDLSAKQPPLIPRIQCQGTTTTPVRDGVFVARPLMRLLCKVLAQANFPRIIMLDAAYNRPLAWHHMVGTVTRHAPARHGTHLTESLAVAGAV
jgi:hypothetical protein